MLRKLAIAIAASGAMMSATSVYALGMGDIELESALNQPLDARIKLIKATELESWEIKPVLASADEFDKTGVERVFFLNNIKFEVQRQDDGEVFVQMSTTQPVVEPFLNFLVQIDWPNGRLLREYTLLLDPPVFSERDSQPITPAQEDHFENDMADADLPGTGVNQEDEFADIPDFEEAQDEPVKSEKPAAVKVQKAKTKAKAKYKEAMYKVRANDTLWEVAIRMRPNRSISAQQAMLAIQDLNPGAFINRNINRLKKNQVLRVPNKAQMLSRSFKEAVTEVAFQNQANAQRKAQLDATHKASVMARADEIDGTKLTLLANGAATTNSKRGASGQIMATAKGDQSKLDQDLSLALENLDKSSRDNQELRSRLDSLEEQINTLQRLINLKDEQMVALQTGMAVKQDVTPKPVVEKAASIVKPEKMLDGEGAAAKGDLNFAETKASEASEIELAKKEQEKPKAKFTPIPEVIEDEPFDAVAFAMENPPVIGGALGALLLALFGVNYARKRKEKERAESLPENAELDQQDPLGQISADLDGDIEGDFDGEFADLEIGSDDDLDDVEADFETAESGLPDSVDPSEAHGGDVLGEAEIYIAYDRLDQAQNLLAKTIVAQPARMDVRLKLMEVLASMENAAEFSEHYDYVVAQGSETEQAQAEQYRESMNSDASAEVVDDLDMATDLGSSDLAADISDDDFSLDLNESEGDLDFNLDSLGLGDEIEPVASLESDDNTLDFDLGLDDALDAPATENNIAEESFEATDDLDIQLDGSDDIATLEIDEPANLDGGDLDFDIPKLDEVADSLMDDSAALDDINLDVPLPEEDSLPTLDLASDVDDNAELEIDFSALEAEEPSIEEPSIDESLNAELDIDLGLDDELEALDSEIELDLDLGLGEMSGSLDASGELETLDVSDEFENLDASDELASVDLAAGIDDLEMPELDAGGIESSELNSDDLPTLDVAAESELSTIELPDLEGDLDLDGDLDFLSGADESETKLDLARAYIDMDDQYGAKEILQEVLDEGTDQQKEDATKMLDGLV